jgi:hypothetical protein
MPTLFIKTTTFATKKPFARLITGRTKPGSQYPFTGRFMRASHFDNKPGHTAFILPEGNGVYHVSDGAEKKWIAVNAAGKYTMLWPGEIGSALSGRFDFESEYDSMYAHVMGIDIARWRSLESFKLPKCDAELEYSLLNDPMLDLDE